MQPTNTEVETADNPLAELGIVDAMEFYALARRQGTVSTGVLICDGVASFE